MSTEKYPAELVEKVASAILDNFNPPDEHHATWWINPEVSAIAALDALDLTAVWGTRTVGREGEPLRFQFEANAREDARDFKTELLNQFVTSWEVVTDE